MVEEESRVRVGSPRLNKMVGGSYWEIDVWQGRPSWRKS